MWMISSLGQTSATGSSRLIRDVSKEGPPWRHLKPVVSKLLVIVLAIANGSFNQRHKNWQSQIIRSDTRMRPWVSIEIFSLPIIEHAGFWITGFGGVTSSS